MGAGGLPGLGVARRSGLLGAVALSGERADLSGKAGCASVEQPGDSDHAAEGDGEDNVSGPHVEPTGLGERIFSNREFCAEHHRSQSEGEDANEVARDRQRDRAEEEDPFFPPCLQREMRVERGDHHEREERADPRAGIGDIHGEILAGRNPKQDVRCRDQSRALKDDRGSEQIQHGHAGVGQDHPQGEGDAVLEKVERPEEGEERERKNEGEEPAPARQPKNESSDEEMMGQIEKVFLLILIFLRMSE